MKAYLMSNSLRKAWWSSHDIAIIFNIDYPSKKATKKIFSKLAEKNGKLTNMLLKYDYFLPSITSFPIIFIQLVEILILEIFFSLMSNIGGAYYKTTNVQDKYCKTDIAENIVFGFLMINLDTLYLKEFLFYMPKSNGNIRYMVGTIITIPFQWYMEVSITP